MKDSFFKDLEDYVIKAHFYECDQNLTVEALYQAFKKRLINEIKEELCKQA